jgi:hypothetical protein
METIEPAPPRTVRDTAYYIEKLAKELRTMAAESNLGFLAYLLSMVEEEAGTAARQHPGKDK